jgi:hypothetical protein
MHLTVGGTELTLDNSGLVCVHKSHDLNSKARHTREMITAFLGRRKRLVWLVADADITSGSFPARR